MQQTTSCSRKPPCELRDARQQVAEAPRGKRGKRSNRSLKNYRTIYIITRFRLDVRFNEGLQTAAEIYEQSPMLGTLPQLQLPREAEEN